MSSGKSKTMPMQMFWGVEAVYYGIVQEENDLFFWSYALQQLGYSNE